MIKARFTVNIILTISMTLAGISWVHAQTNQKYPAVYTLNAATLSANKQRIKAGDPSLLPAYKKLLKDADKSLQFLPVSVMEKKNNPPSGNKHDYMSIAPYFWPDSSKPGGVPYINKDGQVNPEVNEYKDKIYLAALCDEVSTLALAWYLSGEEKYASHAAKLLRVWFLDSATKMNPNINFAQAVKGRATGRGYGLIDTRHFVRLIDAIGLIQNASSWSPKDELGMKEWFSHFLNWMQTSKNGLAEMHTINNHRVWYDEQRISYALFTGDTSLAKKVIERAKEQLEKQMAPDGTFPLEMKRTISLHYTVFVLDPFFTTAQLAENVGEDLWNYETPGGRSLGKGFEAVLPYLLQQKEWTGQQIKPFDYEEAIPLLIQGAKHYHCEACLKQVNRIAGDNARSMRLHLLTDVSF
jgi:hypothetical protein